MIFWYITYLKEIASRKCKNFYLKVSTSELNGIKLFPKRKKAEYLEYKMLYI